MQFNRKLRTNYCIQYRIIMFIQNIYILYIFLRKLQLYVGWRRSEGMIEREGSECKHKKSNVYTICIYHRNENKWNNLIPKFIFTIVLFHGVCVKNILLYIVWNSCKYCIKGHLFLWCRFWNDDFKCFSLDFIAITSPTHSLSTPSFLTLFLIYTAVKFVLIIENMDFPLVIDCIILCMKNVLNCL